MSITDPQLESTTYSGTYKPMNLLSGFDGDQTAGTWQLFVYDDGNGDVGRLNSWSMTVTEWELRRTTNRSM